MNKDDVYEMFKSLSYDDMKLIHSMFPKILDDKLDWKPLKFYNSYKDEMIDFSSTHLVAYDEISYGYKIKSIKTNKIINKKEGKYGSYWTIKKINIGEWQLNKCLKYTDKEDYMKEFIKKYKECCVDFVKHESSIKLRYEFGITLQDVISVIETIDDVCFLNYIEEAADRAIEKSNWIKNEIHKQMDKYNIICEGYVANRMIKDHFETTKTDNKKLIEELKQFTIRTLLNKTELAQALDVSINDYNRKIKNYEYYKLTDDDLKYLFENGTGLVIGTYSHGGDKCFGGYRLHFIELMMAIKIFGKNNEMINIIDNYRYDDHNRDLHRLVEDIYKTNSEVD